jgi:hypothetical protein
MAMIGRLLWYAGGSERRSQSMVRGTDDVRSDAAWL